jgi:ribosome-binding protein aMBF1 (putative translation factor)
MARRRSPEDEEFYLQLGRRIEAARKRKGWSADQLAQEAGIRKVNSRLMRHTHFLLRGGEKRLE